MYFLKFRTQKDDYSCSVIAALNAAIWGSDYKMPKGLQDQYEKALPGFMKTNESGTSDYMFDKALREFGNMYDFKVRKPKDYTTDALTEHLKNGGAVALGHFEHWRDGEDWHHSLWIGYKWGFYIGVNVKAGRKFFFCRRKLFDKMACWLFIDLKGNIIERPSAWLLTKK